MSPRIPPQINLRRYVMLTCALLVSLTISVVAEDFPVAGQMARQDFGTVKAGTVVTQTFPLRRPAPGASVVRVDLSQRGMTARLTTTGEDDDHLALRITLNTTLLEGRVETAATIHWADPAQAPVRFMVTGTVTPVIAVEPFAAVFFSLYQDEEGERTIRIVNRDDVPLDISRLEPVGKHFTASVRTLVEGQEYAVVVRVSPGTERGRFQEGLIVHTNQPTRPEVPIAVNVLVKPDLYASPEVIDFGQVNLEELRQTPALREVLTQVVGIKRRRGPFVVKSVETDVSGLDVEVSPSGPTDIFRMDVTLIPERIERGVVNGTIRLRTDDAIFPEVIVPVRGEVR